MWTWRELRNRWRVFVAWSMITLIGGWSGLSHAADPQVRARARRAYDDGLAAVQNGEFARAAQLFARADQWDPNVVALRSALDAVVIADDPVLGMELAERADNRGDEALQAGAEKARNLFASRVGKLVITCGKAPRCTATLDGRPAAIHTPTWVTIGEHAIAFDVRGQREQLIVGIEAGGTHNVEPEIHVADEENEPTPPPSPTPAVDRPVPLQRVPPREGLSPVWFWIGAGATVALGGAAAISAVDTKRKHDDYEQTGVGSDDGQTSQNRTNILFFSSVGVGIATTALGLFAVRWADEERSVAVETTPAGSPVLRVGGRFW